MSGEHLWSDWIARANLLPRGGDYWEFAKIFKKFSRAANSTFERTRNGTANTKTIKVVCENCNNGWMGMLETEVQPILTPLIKGEVIILIAPQRVTLVQWIVMKLLVAEHNSYRGHPADPIFDQGARTVFMQARAIPDGIDIHIGMQNSPKWVTGYHRHATGLGWTEVLPAPLPPATRTKNVQTVTWGIGKLIIHLSAVTVPEVRAALSLDRVGPLDRLWPLGGDIVWPPRYFVTEEFIDDLADAIERFINSSGVIRPEEEPEEAS